MFTWKKAVGILQRAAFFYMGKLIKVKNTDTLFTNPKHKETEDHITEKFG